MVGQGVEVGGDPGDEDRGGVFGSFPTLKGGVEDLDGGFGLEEDLGPVPPF